jgi:hypothetical protein
MNRKSRFGQAKGLAFRKQEQNKAKEYGDYEKGKNSFYAYRTPCSDSYYFHLGGNAFAGIETGKGNCTEDELLVEPETAWHGMCELHSSF